MLRNFSKGSYVHVIKRGVRGLPIVKDNHDRWKFLRSLYYLNDKVAHINWHREALSNDAEGRYMPRPDDWPKQKPLVKIHAYTLMPNHFHLLIEEIAEGGIGTFMKKIGNSMTKSFNKKYDESGSLFQSAYKSSVVNTDAYLKFLVAYILVKNPFELYPDGFNAAANNFDAAFRWAVNYPFCSLADQVGERSNSPIISHDLLPQLFENEGDFKALAKEALGYMQAKKYDNKITLE